MSTTQAKKAKTNGTQAKGAAAREERSNVSDFAAALRGMRTEMAAASAGKSQVFAGTPEELWEMLTEHSLLTWDSTRNKAVIASPLKAKSSISILLKNVEVTPQQVRQAKLFDSGKGYRLKTYIDDDAVDKFAVLFKVFNSFKADKVNAPEAPFYVCNGTAKASTVGGEETSLATLDTIKIEQREVLSVDPSVIGTKDRVFSISMECYAGSYSLKAIYRGDFSDDRFEKVTVRDGEVVKIDDEE